MSNNQKSDPYIILSSLAKGETIAADESETVKFLISNGYSTITMGELQITPDGRRELHSYQAAQIKPRNAKEWKDEALTGIKKNGKRTDIENGVVPGSKRQCHSNHCHSDTPIQKRPVACLADDPSTRLCYGFVCDPKDPHWGKFSLRKNGKYRTACNKCEWERYGKKKSK